MLLTKKQAQARLPKVGDHLTRVPKLHKTLGMTTIEPQPCTVEYVHTQHLWYRVRFPNGWRECYKVPELPYEVGGGVRGS